MISYGNRRYCSPVAIRPDGSTLTLSRVPFTKKKIDEGWLQQFIQQNPRILPVMEIEPLFAPLIPIGREVPIDSGFIDNLFINPDGYLTIVETKLWRNPEARREVVAQIIDYAKDISKWSYEKLDEQVCSYNLHLYGQKKSLFETLKEHGQIEEGDESEIYDSISRNLQRGRFLLLIVGDGIRENVEAMAEYLSQTPQLNFSLALVELQVYELSSEGLLLVVPQVITRTKEIIRAVVHVHATNVENVKVDLDLDVESINIKDNKPYKKRTLTEQDFFDEVSKNTEPSHVELLHRMLDDVGAFGCFTKWQSNSVTVRLLDPAGSSQKLSLLHIWKTGYISLSGYLPGQLRDLGLPEEIWSEYKNKMIDLIGESNIVLKYMEFAIKDIVDKYDKFLAILKETVSKIRKYSNV